MKKLLYFLSVSLLIACGGEESVKSDSNNDQVKVENDTTAVDTAIVDYEYKDFENVLVKCDNSVFDNIDTLEATFHKMKATLTQEERDSAFNEILMFMNRFDVADDEFSWERENQDKELKEKYGPYGFVVGADEGMFYIMPDMKVLSKKYGADLSPELNDFIDFRIITNKPMFSDAGLIIPFGEYGDMLLDMEDILRSSADSKYFNEMLSTYRSYLWTYLWGLDNTPITTWEEPKTLDSEVEASYNKAKNDSKHKLWNILEPHIKLLEENNYEVPYEEQKVPSNDEIKDLLEL